MSLADNYLFVLARQPFHTCGLTPLVRAANGGSNLTNTGYDYGQLCRNWRQRLGRTPPVWTYIYPTTEPPAAVKALLSVAPDAPLYVLDVEDTGTTEAQVRYIARALATRGKVGLTTFGLPSQCDQRHLPYRAYDWDVVIPQVYFNYQVRGLPEWATLGHEVVAGVSPRNWREWYSLGDAHHLAVWESALVDVPAVARKLAKMAGPSQRPLPQEGDVAEAAITYRLPTLRQGDSGPHVKVAQALLGAAGFYVRVDGDFGPETFHAASLFQGAKDLPRDSVIGPATWHALLHLAYRP